MRVTYATNYLIAALVAFSSQRAMAQTYEESMDAIAAALSKGLAGSGQAKVVISPFKRVEGTTCELSATLTLDLEAAIASSTKTYKLLDRQNLEALASEHKLEMAGLMDEEQRIREAGKLLKADAIIFGYFTLTGDLLTLRVKTVDIQTAEQLVVVAKTAAPNAVAKSLCRATATGVQAEAKPIPNRLPQSEEAVSKPDPANTTDCSAKHTGSYCFTNSGDLDVEVFIGFPGARAEACVIKVQPGMTECFLNKAAGSYGYKVYTSWRHDGRGLKDIRKGELSISECRTESMTIKFN